MEIKIKRDKLLGYYFGPEMNSRMLKHVERLLDFWKVYRIKLMGKEKEDFYGKQKLFEYEE